MRPLRLLAFVFGLVSPAAFAAEKPVVLPPLKANRGDIYFFVNYDGRTNRITEIKVTGVLPGSAAEKLGILEGDRLTAINGLPVVGRRSNEVWDAEAETILLSGPLTFVGRRGTGFFRSAWTITVDGGLLKNKKEPKPAPLAPPAFPPPQPRQ